MKSKRFVAQLDLEFDNEVDEDDLPDMILKALTHKAMPTGSARVSSKPVKPDQLLASLRPVPPQKLN